MAKVCRTLFLGTDDFALVCLKKLLERSKFSDSPIGGIEVVNLPRKKKERASAVQKYAQENNLIQHAWPPLASHIVDRFDTAAVVSFGALLPDYFLDLFPKPCVNVHPSLLPRWRGAAPLAHTIMAGDPVSGVTLLQVSKRKFDIGPILMQESCAVEQDTDVTELSQQLATLGSDMLVKCLENYDEYLENARPQQQSGSTWAKKITKDIAEVDWANMTVKSIIRLQQALCDRYAVKTSFDSIPVRLHGIGDLLDVVTDVDDFIPSSVESGTPGVAFHRSDSNFVCIRCQDGWVTVEEFHFLGEKEHVLAEDFALEQMQDLKEHISDSLGNTTTSNSNTTSNTSNTTSNSNSDNADEDDEDVYYYIGRFSPS